MLNRAGKVMQEEQLKQIEAMVLGLAGRHG